MKRNNVTVTIPSNLVGRKFKEFHKKFFQVGSDCLKEEISKLGATEPYTMEIWNYLEDTTNEVRKVKCIKFGIPVQLCVNFYM